MTTIPIQFVEVDADDPYDVISDWRITTWPLVPRVGDYVNHDMGDDENVQFERFRVVRVEHEMCTERHTGTRRIVSGGPLGHGGVTVYMVHDPDPSTEPTDR